MNIIVCIDKSGGMMFGGRRQSMDKEVISMIIEISKGARLLMSEYSAKMFLDYNNIICDDAFVLKARAGDYCFFEDIQIPTENIEDVYVFNWNRDYPADKYFIFDLKEYKKVKKTEFAGNSHKKITLEVFKKIENK